MPNCQLPEYAHQSVSANIVGSVTIVSVDAFPTGCSTPYVNATDTSTTTIDASGPIFVNNTSLSHPQLHPQETRSPGNIVPPAPPKPEIMSKVSPLAVPHTSSQPLVMSTANWTNSSPAQEVSGLYTITQYGYSAESLPFIIFSPFTMFTDTMLKYIQIFENKCYFQF